MYNSYLLCIYALHMYIHIYDLTPICGSGLNVESRNDISRSMARDSSSNKIFLVSFQMSFYVLEAFLPSLCLPVGMVVWDGDSYVHVSMLAIHIAVLYYTIYYTILATYIYVYIQYTVYYILYIHTYVYICTYY